ncbi:MAG: Rhomboid protease GluP [Elusimicrobia bacterium ADurb.Bin231]|nr:MAG: Rhomboid protease GluP [Elusimicrobia bacterium ADurb.Bin231]
MKCPVCGSEIKKAPVYGLTLDKCEQCGGIWFASGEFESFMRYILLECAGIPFDVVAAEIKKYEDKFRKICPVCSVVMEPDIYNKESDIVVDRCGVCNGVWCDAGELEKMAVYRNESFNPAVPSEVYPARSPVLEKKYKDFKDHPWKYENMFTWIGKRILWVILLPGLLVPIPIKSDKKHKDIPVGIFSILVINIAIFFWQKFLIEHQRAFILRYGFVPAKAASGSNLFSFITSMFLHGDFGHLAGNMFFLWIFGGNIESANGASKFLLLYFGSGIAGLIIHFAFYSSSLVPCIGASGAIAGVMGAYFLLFPKAELTVLCLGRIFKMSAFLYLFLWIFMQVVSSLQPGNPVYSNVGWLAHIGGFFAGVVFALAVRNTVAVRSKIADL